MQEYRASLAAFRAGPEQGARPGGIATKARCDRQRGKESAEAAPASPQQSVGVTLSKELTNAKGGAER